MTIVLATFAKPKVWYRIALETVLLLAVPAVTVAAYYHKPSPGSPNIFIPTAVAMLWIQAIFVARSLKAILSQVLFHNSRLIWIENGTLIWRDPKFFSLSCSDVARISCGTSGQFSQLDTITFQMRDGRDKVIATDAMMESCDDVVRGIRQYLGL